MSTKEQNLIIKMGDVFKEYPTPDVITYLNHNGLKLKPTDDGYEVTSSLAYVVEVQPNYENNQIKAQIRAIEDTDTYRRKLLLVAIGEATPEDIEWLREKEAEKQSLREKLT